MEKAAHRWKVVDDIIVCFTEPNMPIPDDLWDDFLAELQDPKIQKVFSGTFGSVTLTGPQRRKAAGIVKNEDLATAVLVEDKVTRAIIKVMSWTGKQMMSYRWSQIDEACAFLTDDDEQRSRLYAAVRELGIESPHASESVRAATVKLSEL